MRFGSLFSGIGGFDLGLERAGWECRWQVEIDPFCRRVLARHWPHVTRHGDIRTLDLERLERVDLICGGFPCQPVSKAGRTRAQGDARWLWPEFARVVRALRPRFVLVENVPGLLAWGCGDVLGDLAACGYDAEWDCISAEAVGAPHLRDRVWLVGYRRDERAQIRVPDSIGIQLREQRQRDGGQQSDARPAEPRDDGEEESLAIPRAGSVFAEYPGTRRDWWRTEPDVGRVADGIPWRVDRLRGLGNAVVPEIAEWIGRRLKEQAT